VRRLSSYNVTICGFGLIGSSIALDLLRLKPGPAICAYDYTTVLWGAAKDKRFKVQIEQNWNRAIEGADILILSADSKANRKLLSLAGKSSALSNCLIIDVGSTKKTICDSGKKLSFAKGTQFVGCHPMAGNEKSGYQHAESGLFRGNPWFIDSTVRLTKENKRKLLWLTRYLQAKPVLISPDDHDRLVAIISHLPQLLSTLLATEISPKLVSLSGPGLKSMLRLAGSPYSLWGNIIKENSTEIADELTVFRDKLTILISKVRKKQPLKPLFDSANRSYRCL
jgi:prephenate dehydrogenase